MFYLFQRQSHLKEIVMGASFIEQSMMIMLIVCRWMLPRGRIDRKSLSQLLIMYSATSADILDFTDTLGRPEVMALPTLKYTILSVWYDLTVSYLYI